MREDSPGSTCCSTAERRIYRILAVLAVLHAAAVLAALPMLVGEWAVLETRLKIWVGAFTLWFLWPLVLAFHRGATKQWAYASAAAAALLLAAPFFLYSMEAPRFLGLPDMAQMSPYWAVPHTVAYTVGRFEGARRSSDPVLLLEGYGMGGDFTPGAPPFSDAARDKYQIKINSVALCVIDTWIDGHARGYNAATVAAITRRYGRQVIVTAEQEELRRQAEWAAGTEAGRAQAKIDAAAGDIVVVIYGSRVEGEDKYEELLREGWQIGLRRISDAEMPDDRTLAYANGYNEVSWAAIEERHGSEANTAGFAVKGREPYDRFVERTRRVTAAK